MVNKNKAPQVFQHSQGTTKSRSFQSVSRRYTITVGFGLERSSWSVIDAKITLQNTDFIKVSNGTVVDSVVQRSQILPTSLWIHSTLSQKRLS